MEGREGGESKREIELAKFSTKVPNHLVLKVVIIGFYICDKILAIAYYRGKTKGF